MPSNVGYLYQNKYPPDVDAHVDFLGGGGQSRSERSSRIKPKFMAGVGVSLDKLYALACFMTFV